MPDNLSPIYPQFDNLDDLFEEAKQRLPIETNNELIWVIQVVKNTVLNQPNQSK